MTIRLLIVIWIICLDLAGAGNALAASFDIKNIDSLNIEYLTPSDEDRDIRTTNIEAQYLFSGLDVKGLTAYWGVLATYARGEITQLEGSIAAGNLREVKYKTSAFGIGPGVSVSYQLWRYSRVALHVNASGHLIVYNKRFPTGGEYYNFMWRGGPSIKYFLDESMAVDIGYHWVHVSNGRGKAAENPSYEARGVILRFVSVF